jgi:hypothetical protein
MVGGTSSTGTQVAGRHAEDLPLISIPKPIDAISITYEKILTVTHVMEGMDKMSMSNLVSSVEQAVENVHTYSESAAELADLMPYVRAWYAAWNGTEWRFGASKFVGYERANVADYMGPPDNTQKRGRNTQKRGRITRDKEAMPLNGRVTEGVLSRWAEEVEEGHPQFESLHTALNKMLARYGKKPNKLVRISILQGPDSTSAPTPNDDLVALLVAVFHGLTPAQKSAFRRQAAS